MSKTIQKANIMGELVDKFSLKEREKEEFLFGEFVVPIYDIGAHTKNWVSEESRIAITANVAQTFFTVPENERWRVRQVDVLHETGANFDITQVYFYGSAIKHQYIFYNTTTPIVSGAAEMYVFGQDIIMETGQLSELSILVENFVTGGYVSMNILKEVEHIR